MNAETQLLLAKMAAVEKLLELLYTTEFERSAKPLNAAKELSEAALDSISRNRASSVPQASLVMEETVNSFFDRVIDNLRRRGHRE